MKRFLTIFSCLAIMVTMLALPISATEPTETTETTETTESYAEVTIGDANAYAPKYTYEDVVDDVKQPTEEELRDMILRVAEAVGAYEEDLPAAGKVKVWIMDNLASIVGFVMALSLIIATPVGKKIFKNFITALKASMTTVGEWKGELEGIIAKNGEKNAELRASVNELMAQLTRENAAALARAEAAEIKTAEAEERLLAVEQDAAEKMAKSAAVNEAVCRAVLVMAKPLEMTIQKSKALDEMQKHEIFTEYANAVDAIRDLLSDNNTDGEGEDVAD